MAGPSVSRNALNTSWNPGLCSHRVGLEEMKGMLQPLGAIDGKLLGGASVVYFYLATDETEAQTLEMTQLCANKD